MWLPSTIQMASEHHITVLLRYPITILHTCANTQLWHLSIQIVPWYSYSFQIVFLLLAIGATVRMHLCTLKFLHIYVQHVYLATKGMFHLLEYWGNKGGKGRGETKKKTPQFVRGVGGTVLWYSWIERQLIFSFIWTKLWVSPRIFKPKWPKVPC